MSHKEVPHIPSKTIPLLIEEICREENWLFWIEPEYGYLGYVECNGKRHLFNNVTLNINLAGSAKIVKDKDYCAQILSRSGYNVPEGKVFFSEELNQKLENKRSKEAAILYAENLGYPIIVKPNDLSEGTGVRKVHNRTELQEAIDFILNISHFYRIEKFYTGHDYRIVVLDTRVISAYERVPLFIIGDGSSTIRELLAKKQTQFTNDGRPEVIDIDDPRIHQNLERKGYTLASIIERELKFQLLDNANLSTGGESIDKTLDIHPDFREIAIRSTRDIGMRLCGIDIMTGDITRSLEENNNSYVIIEMNGSPGLNNYITSGSEQREYVKSLYRELILSA